MITLPSNPRVVIPIVAGIGNALMTVPLVRQLKRNLPHAHLTIIARLPAMAQVFDRLPEVDQVLVMDKGSLGYARSMLGAAKTRRPDLVILPFPSNRWQYMMLALASRARRRLLHAYPVGYLRALGFLPAHRIPAVRGLHDVAQNLALLRPLGFEPDLTEAPAFPLRPDEQTRAESMLHEIGLNPSDRPIALHPGCARTILAQAKRWPPGSYAALYGHLAGLFGDRIVLLEGPDEAGVGQEIARLAHPHPIKILPLKGSLGEAAAVLQRAELYVGSDSGLAHLAAAVGTPPITLFAPADPDRVCPFSYRHLVLQPPKRPCPCFLYPWEAPYPKMRCTQAECIQHITVDSVVEKVRQALNA